MKYLFNILWVMATVLLLSLSDQNLQAQSVKTVWSLGNINDLSVATMTGEEEYTSQLSSSFAKGSAITATVQMTSCSGDTGYEGATFDPPFMKFQPTAEVSGKTSGHSLSYTVTPAAGHTFKPTYIGLDVAKVGTDGGRFDIYLKTGSGSETAFKTSLVPLRNKITSSNSQGYSSCRFAVNDYLLEGESFTVIIYFYDIATNKEMAFRNLTIEGMVDEPIYTLSRYIQSVSCSAGDLLPLVKDLNNTENAIFPDKLAEDPTDFAITAKEGFEASITYEKKVATISVTDATGTEVFTATIRFIVTARNHGVAKPLHRGLLPVHVSGGNFVSWRMRDYDDYKTTYNLYRDGELVKGSPFRSRTNVLDAGAAAGAVYSLEVLQNNEIVERQDNVPTWSDHFKYVALQRPTDERGLGATYTPNDCAAYDMDGDGEYEIIVKWDPDNSKDSAGSGVTSSVYIDCYKLDGTLLWRINLGQNIRAGAHYTQFLCYDFDGDGFGEMVVKTAPGTIDGEGNYIIKDGADPTASYINSKGHIASGPEWLTIFDGVNGAEISTVNYYPKYGDVSTSIWGDSKFNRSDRYKACVAFLDGERPSAVMMRGYYSGSFAVAYDFDGAELTERWRHSSATKNQGTWGEGAHSVTVGDVDGDGKDEIVVGSACIDDDGSTLWRGGTGHGDALHLGDFDPDNEGLEVFAVYESKSCAYDATLRDAKTGKILASVKQTNSDTGRGLIGNFDAYHPGSEFFHSSSASMYDCNGTVICPWQSGSVSSSSINFRIYWDGDLYDEYHDRQHIDKWNPDTQSFGRTITLYNVGLGASSINSSKHNPNLQADLFGDWREEVIYWINDTEGNPLLNIITTTYESPFALPTLRDDHGYDMAVTWQNVGYNQPPHLSYSPFDLFKIEKPAEADSEWIPFYGEKNYKIPAGVEMYYVGSYSKTGTNDTVTLKPVDKTFVPAYSPILLKVPAGTESLTFELAETLESTMLSANFLRGIAYADTIVSDTEDTERGEFFYEFRKDPTLGYGFFLISSEGKELADNTSYLRVKETSSFKHAPYYLLGSEWNSGVSSIENIRTDASQDHYIYDMMGRRVQQMTRGFYIVGGKKVFIQ